MATGVGSSHFDNSASEDLEMTTGSGPWDDLNNGPPFSTHAWVKVDDQTINSEWINLTGNNGEDVRSGHKGSVSAWQYQVKTDGADILCQDSTNWDQTWRFMSYQTAAVDDHEMFSDAVSIYTKIDSIGTLDALSEANIGSRAGTTNYYDGLLAYPRVFTKALSGNELQWAMWNPFSVVSSLVWHPNMLVVGSTYTDYNDLADNRYVFTAGTIPDVSIESPPVYYYGGG